MPKKKKKLKLIPCDLCGEKYPKGSKLFRSKNYTGKNNYCIHCTAPILTRSYNQNDAGAHILVYDILTEKVRQKLALEYGWYFGDGVCYKDQFDIPHYFFKHFTIFDPYREEFFYLSDFKDNQLVRCLSTKDELNTKKRHCKYLYKNSEYLDCVYLPVLKSNEMLIYQNVLIGIGPAIYESDNFVREEPYDKKARFATEKASKRGNLR